MGKLANGRYQMTARHELFRAPNGFAHARSDAARPVRAQRPAAQRSRDAYAPTCPAAIRQARQPPASTGPCVGMFVPVQVNWPGFGTVHRRVQA
jgi:hypothetical protein